MQGSQTQISKRNNNLTIVVIVFLFVLYPFGAFIYSLIWINKKYSIYIILLFYLLFGLSFDPSHNYNIDGNSYYETFINIQNYSFSNYFNGFKSYLTFSGEYKDYYFETISFLTSLFSKNFHILFFLLSIVFSIFFYKSFHYFEIVNEKDFSIIDLILIVLFIMSNPITNINGCRFWTAFWITLFCLLKIFHDKDDIFFILLCITPIIHNSFIIIVIFVLFLRLFLKLNNIIFIIYIFSFVFSNISIYLLDTAHGFLPTLFQQQIDYYASESYINEIKASNATSHYLQYFNAIISIYLLIWGYIIYRYKTKIFDQDYNNLILVTFGIIIVSNFFMVIPTLGRRFIILSYPLLAFLLYRANKYRITKLLILLIPFVFSFFFYSNIKLFFDIANSNLYSSSLFTIITSSLCQ